MSHEPVWLAKTPSRIEFVERSVRWVKLHGSYFGVFFAVLRSMGAAFQSRRQPLLENVALRHQLFVLNRNAKRPCFSNPDRLQWVFLRAFWSGWQKASVIIQPQTVIGWHRAGFRLSWRWNSRHDGRPPIALELIRLSLGMWQANPTWDSPRLRGELAKLVLHVSDSTIRTYRPTPPRSSAQTWRTFVHHHTKQIAMIDFSAGPTVTFRVLFVFRSRRIGFVFATHRYQVIRTERTSLPSSISGPACPGQANSGDADVRRRFNAGSLSDLGHLDSWGASATRTEDRQPIENAGGIFGHHGVF